LIIEPTVLKVFHEEIQPEEAPAEESQLQFVERVGVRNGKPFKHLKIVRPGLKLKQNKKTKHQVELEETYQNIDRDSGINIDLFWTEEDEKLQQKRIKEQEGELE
jgi:hypothetical protein